MKERELVTIQEFGEELLYNVLPIGKFHDPRYGTVNVTPALVKKLAGNMGKAPSYVPPVKLGHGDGAPSPGVIKEAIAKPDGLHVRLEVDDEAAGQIRAGRYRYMSAEYHPDYQDKKTGEKIGATLLGVALVNQPAHPGVLPIALSDTGEWVQEEKQAQEPEPDKEEDSMTVEELKAQIEALKNENKELADKVKDAVKLADQSAAEAARLKREAHETEVKTFCDGWAQKGVPPVVLDKVRPVLLAEGGGVIKLSDDKSTDVKTLLGEIFEAIPKVNLRTLGDPQAQSNTESEAAVKLGDDIAARANRGKE